MGKITIRLADVLKTHGLIEKSDRDFYAYSIECLIIYILNIGTLILIAAVFGKIPEFLIFIIVFKSLRCNSGGIHAPNWFICYILSCLIITVMVVLAEVINVALTVFLSISCINVFCVWRYAPVEHANHLLDDDAKSKAKLRAIAHSVASAVFCIVLRLMSQSNMSNIVFLAMTLNMLLFLVAVGERRIGDMRARIRDKP